MKRYSLFLTLLITVYAHGQRYPYQNPALSVASRVSDLLGRMTLHEKILQMQHLHDVTAATDPGGYSYGCAVNTSLDADSAAAVYARLQRYMKEHTRWGIPVLTCTEALHGAYQGGCTIYPQSIALGSTFNPDLVARMTALIAGDLQAMNIKQVLAPDLDLARELRWGRVEETYGEDPFLNAAMGLAYVKTAGEHGIICTPKHFVAHGSPSGGLNLASVSGGDRQLRSLYLYPFEKIIKQAGPLSIMNCYSSYDDVPIAGSRHYLTDLLRGELGFKGYVYSDWGSVDMLYSFHHTASSPADAAKQAVEAGIDLEAAGNSYLELEKMVQTGHFDMRYIDQAVRRILYVKFACGLFDHPISEGIDPHSVIHSPQSIALAKEIAEESIVLLKNNNALLPLSPEKYTSIALIGPNADQFQPGDYSWSRSNEHGVTPLAGLQHLVGDRIALLYAKGCDGWSQNKEGFPEAVAAAAKSDIAILVVGTGSGTFTDNNDATAGEGFDLSDLRLPGVQEDLIEAIKATGKPLIVVLVSGKPLAIPWVKENADAIVVQWYGGEQQGNALAEMLFGRISPSGRLNVSFPQSVGNLPCFYNHLPSDTGFYHQPGSPDKPGRDYVFNKPGPLWSFGYGLSYTTFDYLDAAVSKTRDTIFIDVKVQNTGARDGKEVVQLYVHALTSSVVTPVKQLKAFRKVLIKAGATSMVRLAVPISELAVYNAEMKRVVEKGEYELQVGAGAEGVRITRRISLE
jgi:beta-glucosidase